MTDALDAFVHPKRLYVAVAVMVKTDEMPSFEVRRGAAASPIVVSLALVPGILPNAGIASGRPENEACRTRGRRSMRGHATKQHGRCDPPSRRYAARIRR